MIRKGRFAVWNNREFELVSYRREYYLRSENPRDLQLGFSSTDGDERSLHKADFVRGIGRRI